VFSGWEGSYSQIAAKFSTAAILVTCDITSTLAKFTTCSRHLIESSQWLIPGIEVNNLH
jgi:hypothetical protein